MARIVVCCCVMLICYGHIGEVRADQVDELIEALRTNPSYKVRLAAIIGLSKYDELRVRIALLETLKQASEDPHVKGFAARMLARMNETYAIPWLRKASRASSPFLREKAKEALSKLCPTRIARKQGKRFYLNLEQMKASGPLKEQAVMSFYTKLVQHLQTKRTDTHLRWAKCRSPRQRELRNHRLEGFRLDVQIKVQPKGAATECLAKVLVLTYPGNAMKGYFQANAEASAPPSPDVINLLIDSLLETHTQNIDRFLSRF